MDDDGNLAVDYKTVIRDLKQILSSEVEFGLRFDLTACELCCMREPTQAQNSINYSKRRSCNLRIPNQDDHGAGLLLKKKPEKYQNFSIN